MKNKELRMKNEELEMMSVALRNKGRTRNRLLALTVAVFALSVSAQAQRNTGRLSLVYAGTDDDEWGRLDQMHEIAQGVTRHRA